MCANLMITSFLITGGPVVWLLALFSVIATTVILLKIWQFWVDKRLNSNIPDRALLALEDNSPAQARLLLQGSRNPQSRVLLRAIQLHDEAALTADEARVESWRCARAETGELGSSLRILEVIANLAPLLGLFGTVLGMIEAFRAMEAAGARVDPSILSGGIWQALLTTAVGLGVAIPVSIAHSWLERRVEVEAAGMQDKLERLMTYYCTNEGGAPKQATTSKNHNKHA
ncbi:Protein TolQ [Halioglobus japonicus]|nr:Protein TolQ [Halioglobus japonicus]